MEVDENSKEEDKEDSKEDGESSIIRIPKEVAEDQEMEPDGKPKEVQDIDEEMNPAYIKMLDEMIYNEFMQLTREIEAKEKTKSGKRKFKNINFFHVLQKRLKKRLNSRKLQMQKLNSADDSMALNATKTALVDNNKEMRKVVSDKLQKSKRPYNRRALHKIRISKSEVHLAKIKEVSNEESFDEKEMTEKSDNLKNAPITQENPKEIIQIKEENPNKQQIDDLIDTPEPENGQKSADEVMPDVSISKNLLDPTEIPLPKIRRTSSLSENHLSKEAENLLPSDDDDDAEPEGDEEMKSREEAPKISVQTEPLLPKPKVLSKSHSESLTEKHVLSPEPLEVPETAKMIDSIEKRTPSITNSPGIESSSDDELSLKSSPKEEHKFDDLEMSQDSDLASLDREIEIPRTRKLKKKTASVFEDMQLGKLKSLESKGDLNMLDDLQIPLKKAASEINAEMAFNRFDRGFPDEMNEMPPIQKLESKNTLPDIEALNDKLRDELNKKHIIVKIKEILSKSYEREEFINPDEGEFSRENPMVKRKYQYFQFTLSDGAKSSKYVMHLTKKELKLIKKNRSLLLDLGAALFWDHMKKDYEYFRAEDKIEFQISGTYEQVERAKEAIIFLLNYERKIEKEQIIVIDTEIPIPKILIRKIVGYHEKNLLEYKNKYGVDISYDFTFINDESYQIHEETVIKVKGRKACVDIVVRDINQKKFNLIVRTIHMAPADCKFLKEKICQLNAELTQQK